MVEIIVYLVICLMVSLVFVLLGIHQFRSKMPVSLNTGETPPREDELIDMLEWNHKHGRNLIIFGCLFFITSSVYICCLEKFDSAVWQTVIFFIATFAELSWLLFQHSNLKKKLIKDN
jgi:hypothetical protein